MLQKAFLFGRRLTFWLFTATGIDLNGWHSFRRTLRRSASSTNQTTGRRRYFLSQFNVPFTGWWIEWELCCRFLGMFHSIKVDTLHQEKVEAKEIVSHCLLSPHKFGLVDVIDLSIFVPPTTHSLWFLFSFYWSYDFSRINLLIVSVVESILRGETVGITPRRSRATTLVSMSTFRVLSRFIHWKMLVCEGRKSQLWCPFVASVQQ